MFWSLALKQKVVVLGNLNEKERLYTGFLVLIYGLIMGELFCPVGG
jgi:hypothetical protein